MKINLEIQPATAFTPLPLDKALLDWTRLALSSQKFTEKLPISLTIRLTTPEEIRGLNKEFRGKDKPTNVLSFPFEMPSDMGIKINLPEKILGDIAICPEIVMQEALEQNKNYLDHFAHMVIHGILHLLGYDHEEEQEAECMESLEIQLLEKIQIKSPYET